MTRMHGHRALRTTGDAGISEGILRTFYAVYRELGCGFLESVYQHAMETALAELPLDYVARGSVPVYFRGHVVGEFRPDLVVERRVLVEIKAGRAIAPAHEAQVINALRATDLEIGLLLNFGPTPTFRRIVFSNERKAWREIGKVR